MAGPNQLTPEELQSIAAEVSTAFEPSIKVSSLLLLPIDPHRAHANWHIEAVDLEEARAEGGNDAPLVLRLYDVTGLAFNGSNARDVVDTVVGGADGQASLNVWHSGRTYVADLGVRRPDGHLVMLARSEPAHIPPAVRWHPPVIPAEDLARAVAADAPAATRTAVILPEIGPWPGADELAALSVGAVPPVDEFVEEPAPAIDEAHAQQAVQLVSVPAEIAGIVPDLSLPPATPEPRMETTPADETVIALDGCMPWSSYACGAQPGVEVNAELRVYGRVPPGARASLFGRPVDVQKDGAFSTVVPLGQGFAMFWPMGTGRG